MSRRFDAESQEEDDMGTAFPDNPLFHNLPEGQSQLNLRDVNGGGTGHFTFPSFSGARPDTFHSYRLPGDSTLSHEDYPPPGTTTTGFYHVPYPSDPLHAFPDIPPQDLQQTGSFSGEVTNEDNAPTPHSSGLSSNLRPLQPVLSSSQIVGQRFPTLRRNHASGSAIGHFAPAQGGQYNAPSAVGPVPRKRGKKRLSALSVSLSATSARGRCHPYVASNGFEEAGYGNCSFPPSTPAQVVGLQRVPSGSHHRKLLSHDYQEREGLLRDETWLKTQIEEPPITPTDGFLSREYISTTDKTRFHAFVGTNPDTGKVACRITHDVIVRGQSVACAYEAENAKDTIAHVALLFRYKGYKCQSEVPGHSCEKTYPTPERRNDHHAKVRKGADSQIECEKCGKKTLGRNMERHELKCKARTETEAGLD